MDDISSKLSEIMSDPRALEQIKGLGEMLGLTDSFNKNVHNTDSKPKPDENPLSTSMLSPDVLSAVSKIMPILSGANKEDDVSRLLFALRPFLSIERRKKLEEAEKILKIMKILPLLKDMKILDSIF
ncbi:MAG: hypothetical protein IIX27_00355 [Ruminococcus sp.]|nr:hypothetical protein [Ruminococcus sp.]